MRTSPVDLPVDDGMVIRCAGDLKRKCSATRGARSCVGFTGMVGVSTFALARAEAPSGGGDYSGMGREGGRQAIHDYLNVKLSHFLGG